MLHKMSDSDWDILFAEAYLTRGTNHTYFYSDIRCSLCVLLASVGVGLVNCYGAVQHVWASIALQASNAPSLIFQFVLLCSQTMNL